MNVRKGVALVVLVDGGGGNASINDLAKEATHSGNSVQERVASWKQPVRLATVQTVRSTGGCCRAAGNASLSCHKCAALRRLALLSDVYRQLCRRRRGEAVLYLAATEQVQVECIRGLTALLAGIDNRSEEH